MWHTKCVRVRIEERWQTFEMMAWWQLNSRSTLFGGIRVANFRCLMRSKPLVNILLLLSRNSSVIKEKASKTYQLVSSKGMQISDDYRRSLRISTLILLRTTSRHNQSWPLLHFCSTSCCFLPPYQNSLWSRWKGEAEEVEHLLYSLLECMLDHGLQGKKKGSENQVRRTI